MSELTALVRANPGKYNFVYFGNGDFNIVNNSNFPNPSIVPSCNGHTFDNVRPLTSNGVAVVKTGGSYFYVYYNGTGYQRYDCVNAVSLNLVSKGQTECPSALYQGIGSLQGTSETELIINNDSKITIGVVVSIILAVFCAAVMYIFYHKHKTTNNNMKENKDYDSEFFYSSNTTTNNYENQYYSYSNPMDSVKASEQVE